MSRGEVLDWIEAGRVAPGAERDALRAAGMIPARAEWRGFLARLALWLGTIALAAAVIFFFAFNWDDLGRFAKFGLLEAAIVAGLLALWWTGLDGTAGKALLTLLSLLVGALLALTGQVYQTGADTFELFAWWAVLILPWVVAGRFSPLWLLWLGLVNLALWFYFSLGFGGEALMWALFALNGLALAAWEAAHRAGVSWLRDDWPPRLVAVAAGSCATGLAIWSILDRGAGILPFLAWLGVVYYWYRHVRPDLFMLAGGLLGLIVVVVAFLTRHMFEAGSASFLFIGLVVIGLSGGGAMWLKSVAREQRA
jgi:uncharacterized membrane protein